MPEDSVPLSVLPFLANYRIKTADLSGIVVVQRQERAPVKAHVWSQGGKKTQEILKP